MKDDAAFVERFDGRAFIEYWRHRQLMWQQRRRFGVVIGLLAAVLAFVLAKGAF